MFNLNQIGKQIFQLSFKNPYDLAMHFLRATEYFECPHPDFYKTNFEILPYIEWYIKKEGKTTFTYPNDWAGFNLSCDQMDQIYGLGKDNIPDPNLYDSRMETLHNFLLEMSNYKYHLIGTKAGDNRTLKHEIAHALYYLRPNYKKAVLSDLNEFENKFTEEFETIKEQLVYLGYVNEIELLKDEMHAYMVEDKKFHVSFGVPKETVKECVNGIKKLFSVCYKECVL